MSHAEDVKKIIPDSGSPYIEAGAVIKHVLPPVDDSDVATKASSEDAASAAVLPTLLDSAEEVPLVDLTTLTDSELAIDSVNARVLSLGEAINRLEAAIAAQNVITLPA